MCNAPSTGENHPAPTRDVMHRAAHASLDLFMDLVHCLSSVTYLASPDAPSELLALPSSDPTLSTAFGFFWDTPEATNIAEYITVVADLHIPPTTSTTPVLSLSPYLAAALSSLQSQTPPTRLPVLGSKPADTHRPEPRIHPTLQRSINCISA
eukprot:GFKZ01008689.1.p1 GENE.GFKZ01008689.1~~GFKZ01008689.1.p1  ORF type:complete len:153 (+),score=7.85 GFKZ01008689.1:157-615(+)